MMRMLWLALALHFTPCSVKAPSYSTNLAVRMLACDWQVKCKDDVCAVKWQCPWQE